MPNAETVEAIQEVKRMKADPSLGKTYSNVDQMMRSCLPMYNIRPTTKFQKDLKRVKKRGFDISLLTDIIKKGIIEVMGRDAGYLALWCGIANGAEDILLPEKYDYDEQRIINNIIDNRKKGKKHHIIINAEGIGHSEAMAKRIEAATGIETRATILGHMQRGGTPTCKDRVYASIMGAKAVDVLLEGKTKRVICYRNGEYVDMDINEALSMKKSISEYQYEVSYSLSHNYTKNQA